MGSLGKGDSGHVQRLGPLPQVGMSFSLNYDNADRIIFVWNQVNHYEFFFMLLVESSFEPVPGGDSEIWE